MSSTYTSSRPAPSPAASTAPAAADERDRWAGGREPTIAVRRPWGAVVALVLAVTLAVVLLGGGDADAQLADPVAGHVVVEPGQTLWDVAVASAPDDVDARAQVRAIQELNGLDGAEVDAWTVLLLPAR